MNSDVSATVITQSNYIPWKGYFDQISSCDHFVFYDCVQYTRRDWRNRNQIKTPQGLKWLTIPVNTKGNFNAPIEAIQVANNEWSEQHWTTIRHNYRKADCFNEMEQFVLSMYEKVAKVSALSEINQYFIVAIAEFLGLPTIFHNSSDFSLAEGRNERLIGLAKNVGANVYISGPAAKSYVEERQFADSGITVRWFDYSGYPQYPQLYGEFVHGVSILDLLFSVGKESNQYIRKQAESLSA